MSNLFSSCVGIDSIGNYCLVYTTKKIQKLKPNYLIIEPPELVGGKISVSKAKPDLIEKISKELKTKFIVGAGIHTKEDVKVAMKLGASGIAISSAITKAKKSWEKIKRIFKFIKQNSNHHL